MVDAAPSASSWLTTQVDRRMVQLLAHVADGVAGATDALLSGDREAARGLAERDDEIEVLAAALEELLLANVVGLADAPERLRYLIAALRLLPHVERGGELAEELAWRGARGLGSEMSARARGLIERMGQLTCTMWRLAADAFVDRNPELAEEVRALGDQLDELEVSLGGELGAGLMTLPVIVELSLVGHFYDRLGAHATAAARRAPTRLLPSEAARADR